MIFDWDENKEKLNIKNHDGITFEEAGLAVQDEFAFEEFDSAHSTIYEKRYACVGEAKNKLLYVVYAIENENTENEIFRIISARLAEPEEKDGYEQQKYNSGFFE